MKLFYIIYYSFLFIITLQAQPRSLSITEFKQQVLTYSRQIKQRVEERNAIVEAIKVAQTAFFPTFDFSGNYQYRLNSYALDFGSEMIVEMDRNTYSLGASVSQPLYTGGRIYHQFKMSKIQEKIALAEEALTTENILYTADISYWSAAAQKGMHEVMKQYVYIVKALEKVLINRFEEGLISKTDLLQVQARLKEAELNKNIAYKAYELALQNMNILMGLLPSTPLTLRESITKELPIPIQTEQEATWTNRQEYQISLLNIAYQKQQLYLSKAKYNPTLSIGFQANWGTPLLNVKDSKQRWTPALVASLQIPLFRWGARMKEIRSHKALLQSRNYALDITRDQIRLEVSQAWTSFREDTKMIHIAEEACRIAEENLNLNTFSYTEGKLPIIDVLSAQLVWFQSFSNLIQSWYQQKISLSQYYKAIGFRQF